jgi:uncharacterized protein YkwD
MCTTIAIMGAVVLVPVPVAAAGGQARTANSEAEAAMIAAINEVRAQNGLYALRASSSLADSAGRFSRWLMKTDTFGHVGSIQASSRFSLLGEALAFHVGRDFGVRRTVDQWMGSPSHRVLVLSTTMRWMGTGVTRGRMGSKPATVWVLHLGRLRAPEAAVSNPGTAVPDPPLPLP